MNSVNLTPLLLAFCGHLHFAAAQSVPEIPEGTQAFRDLSYVTNGHERQKLDLYVPEKREGPTPLLVWIHGGGWAEGDKTGCPPLKWNYIQRGYAIASLGYRLSGHARFPAQIEDCKAAIRWLRAHADKYDLDGRRIGVCGASAGGHLAALLGATGCTREFDVGENLDQSSAVHAVCDYFGPIDLIRLDAHAQAGIQIDRNAPDTLPSRLVGGPIQEQPYRELAARANPIRYLGKDAPPYLVIHGDKDSLVPHNQSVLLYSALEALGVPVHFHTIRGARHGRGFAGPEIGEMVAAFFDYRLLGSDTTAADWPVAMTSESVAVMDPSEFTPGH